MKRVKVGVVGLGGIFRGAHLPAYPEVREAQLKALCDISTEALDRAKSLLWKVYSERINSAEEEGDSEKAEMLRDDLKGVKLYPSLEEMLSSEELDLVDVCTPTKFHNTVAIEALKSGVNVMVEKPMARTYLECLDVIEAVEESGRFYQHNENWLYLPLWYSAKKFVESGVIGELQYVFTAQAHGGPEWATWFWNPDIAGGGSLLDNGVHGITTAWFLGGFEMNPVVVKAVGPYGISIRMRTRLLEGMFKPFEVEDDAHIIVRYEDDEGRWLTTHIEGSWSYRDSVRDRIIGSSGEIEPCTKGEEAFLRIEDASGNVREVSVGKTGWLMSFIGEIRNMCKCVLNRVKPLCNERVGAETTAIVQAAYLSQKRGRKPVTLEEFKNYALKVRDREGDRAPDILLRELLKGVQRFI